MAKIWYLYLDGGYESNTVLFAVPSKELAKACQVRMMKFKERAVKRMPELPEDIDHPDFDRLYAKRESIEKKLRWPYGIDLSCNNAHDVMVASMPVRGKA